MVTVGVLQNYTQENIFLLLFVVEQNTITFSPNYSRLAVLLFSSCCKTSRNGMGTGRVRS